MSQLQSCLKNPACDISFQNLGESIDNPIVCPNPEMCIDKFKPSDKDALVLYNAVASCYSMDPQCIPSSGSESTTTSAPAMSVLTYGIIIEIQGIPLAALKANNSFALIVALNSTFEASGLKVAGFWGGTMRFNNAAVRYAYRRGRGLALGSTPQVPWK